MELSNQFLAPASLTPRYTLKRRRNGPKVGLDISGGGEKFSLFNIRIGTFQEISEPIMRFL